LRQIQALEFAVFNNYGICNAYIAHHGFASKAADWMGGIIAQA
jgi:hypothetical protein